MRTATRSTCRRLPSASFIRPRLSTRSTANYVSGATWAVGELQKIYVDAEMEIVETGNWHAKVARRDYTVAVNGTGAGIDDPDVPFFENFSCGSQRNYSDYCNPELQKLFDKQSAMVNVKARRKLAQQIERQLVEDVARISLGFRINYNARYKYVKNFVGHNTNYNWPAWDEIWMDK